MSTGQKRGQGRDGAKEESDRAWREGEEEDVGNKNKQGQDRARQDRTSSRGTRKRLLSVGLSHSPSPGVG